MKSNKWLYFRAETDMANDDGSGQISYCAPAENLVSMSPSSDTGLNLTFRSTYNSKNWDYHRNTDVVKLTVVEGDMFEVMEAISQAINDNPHGDGFVVIADDCLTTDSAVTALNDVTIKAEYVHPSITACNAISRAAATYNGSTKLPDMGMGSATTAISNGLALSVNTNYHSVATAAAMTLPDSSTGVVGDWISVHYTTVINNGATHTFTTTGDTTFHAASTVTRIGGGVASGMDTAAGTTDNILTIDGDTNGDGGIGTTVRFVNVNGGGVDGWRVEAVVLNQGDGSVAMAGATAFS